MGERRNARVRNEKMDARVERWERDEERKDEKIVSDER